MNNAITTALDVLYADPNIGENAVLEQWTSPSDISVRIVVEREEAGFDTQGISVVSQLRLVHVRRKEAPTLYKGDLFHVAGGWTIEGGTTLEVIAAPELDGTNDEWTAQVREVTMDSER